MTSFSLEGWNNSGDGGDGVVQQCEHTQCHLTTLKMFKMINVISNIFICITVVVWKKKSLSPAVYCKMYNNQLWERGILVVLTLIETLPQWSSSSNSVISLNAGFERDAKECLFQTRSHFQEAPTCASCNRFPWREIWAVHILRHHILQPSVCDNWWYVSIVYKFTLHFP